MSRSESDSITDKVPISIEAFLQDVEKKAYRIALFSVREHAEALDLLQDAMVKLVTKYADKKPNEWKPLFYRILQNRITDWHRQQKVKSFIGFFTNSDGEDTTEDYSHAAPHYDELPDQSMETSQQQQAVMDVLKTLPAKQQQCFLLRSWEGMSVAETALAMGCSEGSVKTHFFRAVTKLRALLEEQHDVKI
ncbi:RNA polymerase sigma factor [Aestuariibacter sp. AA17]|uniref:RNA polymerase sigma factor n=1 Tax=Fluctibacter corallii TaxID=2984329 RepID=A0ABT3A525_9ALTE|nr:RNA polymerase sigma factor [Aestuariibacter sp. AA17]MCV2883782.1 RNA polymerase sigma factor [Aestuariibacter sp. AA17]